MVHAAAATRDIVGLMRMKTTLSQVIGGATLKNEVSMRKKRYGKHALKILIALGIDHVVVAVSTRVMKKLSGMFASRDN